MQTTIHNRTIAMSAIFQCVSGVMQIANEGRFNESEFKTCIDSLLNDDAATAEDLYGGLKNLAPGIKCLSKIFSDTAHTTTQDDADLTRYAVGLLHLEKKLDKYPNAFDEIMKGITEAQTQADYFKDSTHSNVIKKLADIYANTVSNIGPKLLIKGDEQHLGNSDNAAKIRALLLAGIRASLLWRQAGGNRWKLFLERKKIQNEARDILNTKL